MSTPTSTIPATTPAASAAAPLSTTTSPTPIAAFGGVRRVPQPVNDPNRSYAPGSPERAELKARLKTMAAETLDIPLVIGGREIRTGNTAKSVMPHDHRHVLADYHLAGPEHVAQAIAAAADARREWGSWPWEDRAAVLLRAAELLATTWRATLNAATMLGQSKTAFQAEIDAASEMIDFWRFNTVLRAGAVRRAADQRPRRLEPDGVPAARRLRLRDLAVQLHRDRRQPHDRARADGQHGRLEAGLVRDAERLLHAQAARDGGHAARRDQLRPRRRPARSANLLLDSPGARRRALHRQHRRLPGDVAEDRREHRALPLVSAPGRRDRRQGLHRRRIRPRIPRKWRSRSCAAGSSIRGRSARRRAASTCRDRSGTTSASARSRS